MRTTVLRAIQFALMLLVVNGCKDITDQDIYQKPEWLQGKLYTQISSLEELSLFKECLELVGYDSILDKSGSYTVFAPNDDAIEGYLLQNQYSTIHDVPLEILDDIVKFHIIQDAWSENQLQMLDFDGWIDPMDPDSKPSAYKRQSILKNQNEKYWIQRNKSEDIIVLDSTDANAYKKVYTRSRKFVPIFFDAFFDIYNLNLSDYEFYFDRPFEAGNLFYADAKVLESDIFAENGFVFVVDRVVKPMLNAKELLEKDYGEESYKSFLDLVYQFPVFKTNLEETYNTPEARAGLNFDTLYNLSFPKLPFDLHEEITGPNVEIPEYAYLTHNGVFIPSDQAFQSFIDEILTASSGYPHWANFESVPIDIKQIIVKSHFATSPVYPSDMENGFEDGDGNIITLSQEEIVRKEFGSNCTFLGLNSTVIPRAFSSVTGPVYLRPGYSLFMYAMQYTRILPALTKADAEYSFFPIPDNVFLNDSSLMINWIDVDLNRYNFKVFDRAADEMRSMSAGVLAKRIMNQVGISVPNNSANKEYIETLGGNYIIWNNTDNTVQGGLANTFGYNGDSLVYYHPVVLEEPSDNGDTWMVESWFRNVNNELYGVFNSSYRYFRDLMEKVDLYDIRYNDFPFLVDGESYTIFMPSEQALADFQVDTLTNEELESLLRYHFVKGEKIFTDNKKLWNEYETLRKDESSSQSVSRYSKVNIKPGPDVIDIIDGTGNLFLSIPESEGKTNIMIAYDTDEESEDRTDFITTIILHEIDQVLDPKILK